MNLTENKTILIVEDEAIVAKDLQLRLQAKGFQVPAPINNGRAAIDYVAHQPVDLILMDIHLSGDMDGIQAATEINAHSLTPIIYLTAFSELDTVKEATVAEPFGYIVKPYDEQALFIQIEVALYKFQKDLEVRNREKWFKSILAQLREAVITADTSGIINYVNSSGLILLDTQHDAIVGTPIISSIELFDEEGRSYTHHPVTPTLEKGVSTISETIMLKTQTGHLKNVECTISPLRDQAQAVVGVLMVIKEQSDLIVSQQELHNIHNRRTPAALSDDPSI